MARAKVTRKKSDPQISVSVRRGKETIADISVEDRLTRASRGEHDSIVYLGELVERILKGEFGAIIKALTAGRISRELSEAKQAPVSSDRILGRIEMAENLWNDLEQFVLDKDVCLTPKDSTPIESEYVHGHTMP